MADPEDGIEDVPRQDASRNITIGPSSRVTFVGGALTMLVVGVWLVAGMFNRLEAKLDDGLTKREFSYWTMQMAERQRRAGVDRPLDWIIYWPPEAKPPEEHK